MSAFLLWLWFLLPTPCIRDFAFEPMSVRIMQPMQRYHFVVRVRVEPHDDHRMLDLSWEGDDIGSGHSTRQLEGAQSEVAHRFMFVNMQGGRWTFTARVVNAKGKVVAAASIDTILVGAQYIDAER